MKKVFVDCFFNKTIIAVTENGNLIELIAEDKNEKISAGNIYSGTVKKILPYQFAFIDIGDSKNSFLHLSDKKEENLYKYNNIKNKKELIIKQGDEILVQVEKESSEIKGAVVTTQLSFTGKYSVLLLNQSNISVSKKIEDEIQKQKLKEIAKETLPDNFGIILRTNCKNAKDDEISEEIKSLLKICSYVLDRGKYVKAPSLVYKGQNEIQKIIRDYNFSDDDEIIINKESLYNELISSKINIKNIILYQNDIPIFENYFIQKQIERAMHNKIWLKSGGFIIIEQTEACVVIDVNTGKYSGKNHRQAVLKTNTEAALEVALQIRIRNLSGIIIIDFIDMNFEEDKKYITNLLKDEFKKDRINTFAVGMTELGLMQVTRKKIRQPLNKVLMCECKCCRGTGLVLNEYYAAEKIKNKIYSILSQTIYNELIISTNKRIINIFLDEQSEFNYLENKYNAKIIFRSIQTEKYDYFEIEKNKI